MRHGSSFCLRACATAGWLLPLASLAAPRSARALTLTLSLELEPLIVDYQIARLLIIAIAPLI